MEVSIFFFILSQKSIVFVPLIVIDKKNLIGLLFSSKMNVYRFNECLEGYFACTNQEPAHDQKFVLGTRGDFSFTEPSTLQFSYYMAGIRFVSFLFR